VPCVSPPPGAERDRLWQRFVDIEPEIDDMAERRATDTPVVVLEPRIAAK